MFYSLNYSSSFGKIVVISDDHNLLKLDFVDIFINEQGYIPETLRDAKLWLDRYFAREDPGVTPSLAPQGTEFQKRVWNELLKLKRNEIITYSELAKRVGSHPRAVGQAVGRNPLPLFIPCHRIIAVNGLGGYTPGVGIKEKLLLFESGREDTLDFTV